MFSSIMPAKFAVTVTLHTAGHEVYEGTKCWHAFEGYL